MELVSNLTYSRKFFACYLDLFQQQEKLSTGEVAKMIGCVNLEAYYRLGLCLVPDEDEFYNQKINNISSYIGVDRNKIKYILEKVKHSKND